MEKKGNSLSGGRGIAVCVILFGLAGFLTYRTLTTAGRPVPEPVEAVFMCSETHMTFPYAMHEGEHWPVVSPFTGKKTGYPAERCYWTRDGKRKATPTYVILNASLGLPGDTFCPDCGRIVIGHNPPPPPDTPLASPEPAAQQPAGRLPETPSPSKPATPAGTPPVTPSPTAVPPPAAPAAPPPAAARPASPPAVTPAGPSSNATPRAPQDAAAAERVLYATIRAKMDEMIQQRAQLLKSGKTSSDPEVSQLEASILKARQLLLEKGEVLGDVAPPIVPASQPGK